MNFDEHPMHDNPLWWVNRYSEISDYEKLIKLPRHQLHKAQKIMALNFRIFDYFGEVHLQEVLNFLVFIMDHAPLKNRKSDL
jgi:hypothetical protein